jgi:hypothetical protein
MSMDYVATEGGVLVPQQGLIVGGIYQGQIVRDGKIIEEFEDHNLVVNEGLNHMLDVLLHGSTQVATWYLGVFEGNYTPVATVTAKSATTGTLFSAAAFSSAKSVVSGDQLLLTYTFTASSV